MKFWFNKKNTTSKIEALNDFYKKLKEVYPSDRISDDRKNYLSTTMEKYGYLPYPFFQAHNELTYEEILFALEFKWKQNNVFENNKFTANDDNISVLARNNVTESKWIQKEGHDIKLINLAGLGDGNKSATVGKFMDWLKQLLILPTGNLENNIFNTTLYLIPFHPREFGCAYLPKTFDVSPLLEDSNIKEKFGLNAKQQVQTFIEMAQLAGHPVIYDILPQCGRFAKIVLANPFIARWFDINELNEKINAKLKSVAKKLESKYKSEDIEIVINFIKTNSLGELSEHFKHIYDEINEEMIEFKKSISNEMMKKQNQEKLHKRVKSIVARLNNIKKNNNLSEDDITNQNETITQLIAENLWPAPGGAWCSAGVPIYDKMSDCGSYPLFEHYNYKGENVTHFANLDCQTPYYFIFLENGTYNNKVVDLIINEYSKLQADYNFDGFRIDHLDHLVDDLSEQNGKPISYRAPRLFLQKLNKTFKSKIPYFATLAEYMLWDNYYKEYHEVMGFDLLWGNDIVSQSSKTPEQIVDDNLSLNNYNLNFYNKPMLSFLKTYNNQDGEFAAIDRYPAQLGFEGALFKWFKYKLLPGGKYAQRPSMYIDGDESFTKTGIEKIIGSEIAMVRENNYDFFNKFDAIDRFVKSQSIITDGEAQIISQEDDGFVSWLVSKAPIKTAFLIIANYNAPQEKFSNEDENGNTVNEIIYGQKVYDKTVNIPGDFAAVAEYVLNGNNFDKVDFKTNEYSLHFNELRPSEFKIFVLQK